MKQIQTPPAKVWGKIINAIAKEVEAIILQFILRIIRKPGHLIQV